MEFKVMVRPFLVLLICLTTSLVKGQDKCDNIQLDECGYKLYSAFSDPKTIASNQEEFHKYCVTLNEGYQCVKDKLKDCPTIISSKIKEPYLKQIAEANDKICVGNQTGGSIDVVKLGSCLKSTEGVAQCARDFLKGVEASTLEAKTEQLLSSCCAFGATESCTHNAAQAACGKEAADGLRTVMREQASFLVGLCATVFNTDPEKQCSERGAATPLPDGHRQIKSPLPGYASIVINHVGP